MCVIPAGDGQDLFADGVIHCCVCLFCLRRIGRSWMRRRSVLLSRNPDMTLEK